MPEDLSDPHRDPPRASTFVGRTRDLVGLGADLMRHRLITLCGPGGVGKSRLAAEVAQHAASERHGEMWWIDLKPLPPGADVTPAVLAALRLSDVAGRSGIDQLAAFLGARGALLVLDNAEHVLTCCRRMVIELLGANASVVVLVTSRTALDVPGERVRELDPLELPDRTAPPEIALRSPAALLFLDRAREARPDLIVGDAVARDIVELCHRLDGLPLALELAAAGAARRTIAQLREALTQTDAGFEPSAWLEGSHPALVGCIRWSYDLLTEPEQALLRRLSVVAGAFAKDAMAVVCPDEPSTRAWPQDALQALVAKSLVRRSPDGRFFLLQTVRAFAAAELTAAGEGERLADRHLAYALAIAERTERDLIGASAAVLDRLAAALDDQRLALQRALIDADAERALRLGTACGFVLVHRSRYHEAMEWVGAALARPGGTAASRVQAYFVAGFAGDTWLLLEGPCELAMQAVRADDHVVALAWVERGTGLARLHGNDYILSWLLTWGAYCHLRRGALTRAREAAQEAGERARSVGEGTSMAYADYMLAETELTAGRPDHARRAAERGLAASERSQTLAGREALRSQHAQACVALGAPDGPSDLTAAVQAIDPATDPWEYCAAALALATHRAASGDGVGATAPLERAAHTGRRLASPWVAAKTATLEGILALDSRPGTAADLLHTALALSTEHSFDLVAVDAVEALTLGLPRSLLAQVLHDRTAELLAKAPNPSGVRAAAFEGGELTFHQVVAHLVRGRGTRGRPATGWTSLTTAEREVAALAAEGLSNPAIAARLLVAPGTIKTHLGRIYAKLAVANRTEFAAAAARRAPEQPGSGEHFPPRP